MNLPIHARITLVMALLGAGACAAPQPMSFGRAYEEAKVRQIENPAAGEHTQNAEGQGPATAHDVLTNYHENQKTTVQEQRQRRQRQNGLVNLSNR